MTAKKYNACVDWNRSYDEQEKTNFKKSDECHQLARSNPQGFARLGKLGENYFKRKNKNKKNTNYQATLERRGENGLVKILKSNNSQMQHVAFFRTMLEIWPADIRHICQYIN